MLEPRPTPVKLVLFGVELQADLRSIMGASPGAAQIPSLVRMRTKPVYQRDTLDARYYQSRHTSTRNETSRWDQRLYLSADCNQGQETRA
jgi:hypothetical protein